MHNEKGKMTWHLRRWLPERFGQRCEVLVAGRGPGPRNILVRFPDGHLTIAGRWSVRRAPPDAIPGEVPPGLEPLPGFPLNPEP